MKSRLSRVFSVLMVFTILFAGFVPATAVQAAAPVPLPRKKKSPGQLLRVSILTGLKM